MDLQDTLYKEAWHRRLIFLKKSITPKDRIIRHTNFTVTMPESDKTTSDFLNNEPKW